MITSAAPLTPAIEPMHHINLIAQASALPQTWRSQIVGLPGGSNLKVLRMDAASYEEEVHDYNEALLVLDGCMNLQLGDTVVPVRAGEVYVVPAGVPHGVAPGSHGTLVIVDPQA